MDAEMSRADDITRLYREGLMTASIIAHDMGASEVAKVLRLQASRACPFGPVPGACNDNCNCGDAHG
jgi:hypothetical protein